MTASHVVAAFTPDQVVRLTGLTQRQLARWDRTSFFPPAYADLDRRSRLARLYSFRDVVGLRVLHHLRHGYAVPLPHLREVAHQLADGDTAFWATKRLKVWNRRVHVEDAATGRDEDALDGQGVLFPLRDMAAEVEEGVAELRRRDPATVGRIARRRGVVGNAPVIAGTRVPVAAVREFLRAGATPAGVVEEYPLLTEDDVRAVMALDELRAA